MECGSSHLPHLLLLFFSLLTLSVGKRSPDFRICAYNVQKFDKQKSSNYKVLHTLTRVVYRCDICLLQHVVDPDGSAIKKLLTSINRESERYEGFTYKSVSSKPLGRSPTDMQQYVFIYRTQTVNETGQYQYQSEPQVFTRDPFAVQFQSSRTKINSFVLIALHSEPPQAVTEMNQLHDVFLEVIKKWDNKNVMFLGDFHAGCAYMTRSDKKNIQLFSNTSFSWLIGDKVDTTVTDKTNCPYDRIVVHGKTFLKAITPFSAQVYNFGKQLKISKSDVTRISDHFPIEVTLRSRASLPQVMTLMSLLLSISVVTQSFVSL
ncbi:deoxyribonuclease-1-like isoform X2 [Cynoglossus semilaevis]|uniref:deoxyribonuclease-1-like isoform X2 n=1 Tax=Cynoglossus semilaevis TaxID=244447 RepID=UPI000495877B|nr:deoxyribonuclease-1-like isoform X2 [Cynoglossus semilaevis]